MRSSRASLATAAAALLCAAASAAPSARLKVSDNHRFLITGEGKPFFYLGDTAWELFHCLTREEADLYLRTRAEQRFTVIQAVALAEFDGLRTPNAYGHLPLVDGDPGRPVEEYFLHVDWIVRRANELGLWVGMLPTWGDKWNKRWGKGPEIFTPENARAYGAWIAGRYRDAMVIWILGGDRAIESDAHRAIIAAMAAGLREGDGGSHLITFHPMGGRHSSEFVHQEPWLDFNMIQSGHAEKNIANYEKIARDYALTPTKPCMDAEPCYENHPVRKKKEQGWFDEWDARKLCYWALFAGAHGHTYGCHDIWAFHDPAKERRFVDQRTPWQQAIRLPGANQMRHARSLMESRPFLTRIPDQSLIVGGALSGADHLQATRDARGAYAFVYSPSGKPFTVDLSKLSGARIRATWFDPRNGESSPAGEFPGAESRRFAPPSSGDGHDWVLVLDDAAAGSSARLASRHASSSCSIPQSAMRRP
ncbi:MAG: glycoside hydrolase family 140 protein [Verrucomicrobiae bacterium]|nr:glycoside hydrolase family 140 protein [Verrucomicrobiae bacterium]